MFFQICLVAAGLHLVRKLLRDPSEPPDRTPEEAAATDAPAEPLARVEREAGSRAVGGADRGAPDAPHKVEPTPAALDAADAEAKEQLSVALVSMGLTAYPGMQALGGVGLLYGSIPTLQRAAQGLLSARFGLDLLESLSLVAALAARQFLFCSVLFLLTSAAQRVRTQAERDTHRRLRELFERHAPSVWVLRDGVGVSVPLSALAPGDLAVVDAGSVVPVDGVVVEGGARVQQQHLAGSPPELAVGIGDEVPGLSVVLSGRLVLRVTASGERAVAAEVSRILRRTSGLAATIEEESKQFADASALPILVLSALAPCTLGTESTLALLNISTVDNLRMAAPYSMLNSLRASYEQGILMKDGRALQLLSQVDTIVFAKPETLTQGQLQVRDIHTVRGVGEDELLAHAAAAEPRQDHPIGRALIREARRRGIVLAPRSEIELELGYGLSARLGQQTPRIGSERFMESLGIQVPESLLRKERAVHQEGRSVVYVALDRSVLGAFELEPLLRPETVEILRALRKRNQCLYLLSGDHEAPARALAQQLPLDYFMARVPLHDKARIVHDLQRSGRQVCFVGDGPSDALALGQATVSVSMGGTSTAVMDPAQIVLLDSGLGKLPQLFDLADESRRNMRNLLVAAAGPAAVAVGGVCFAGFTQNAVQLLYFASLAASGAIAEQTAPRKDT